LKQRRQLELRLQRATICSQEKLTADGTEARWETAEIGLSGLGGCLFLNLWFFNKTMGIGAKME
jgi:hypothetical protein